jgi:hypothetical protein
MGLYDDLKGLEPWPRLVAQTIAGIAVAIYLIQNGTLGQAFNNQILDYAITIIWIVGICNSINFFDNLDGGFTLDKLVVFNYSEMGNDLLEDGLYAMGDKLADPAFADKMVRFVRASQKGWQYAIEHPDEAAQIVIDNDESGAQTLAHQTYMMSEVAKLVDATDFKLNMDAYARTEKALLDQKIIKTKPEGAFTTEITDKL